MRAKAIAVIVVLLLAGVAARAQTVNPHIQLRGAGGAPNCTVGQQCVATGPNFLPGYKENTPLPRIRVFSVMPDGAQIEANSVVPNTNRLIFYPALNAKGAVRFRIVGPYYDWLTAELAPTTEAFSPVLHAAGVACYKRPSPGACQNFAGILVFHRDVGILNVQMRGGGLGALSEAWTVVIENAATSEESTFAVEVPARSFPASSANPNDVMDFQVPRLAGPNDPAVLNVWISAYIPAPDGTIIKTNRVMLPLVFE